MRDVIVGSSRKKNTTIVDKLTFKFPVLTVCTEEMLLFVTVVAVSSSKVIAMVDM